MSRGSIIKNIKDEREIKEAEIVKNWSKKRIIIAIIVLIILILGIFFVSSLLSQRLNNALVDNKPDKPEINLPNKEGIQTVLNNAKQQLNNVNAQNVVESQPQIRQIISDLNSLSGASGSAKSLICDTLCK